MTRATASLPRVFMVLCETTTDNVQEGVGSTIGIAVISSCDFIEECEVRHDRQKSRVTNHLGNGGQAVAILHVDGDVVLGGKLFDDNTCNIRAAGQYDRRLENVPK